MAEIKRIGDLELGQDLMYQRRKWVVERTGWTAMLLLILAALTGLFGAGPLSKTRAESTDALLSVEYDRFARLMSPLRLRVHIDAGAVQDDEIRLWISRAYLERTRIQHITPQPSRVETGPDRLIYVFRAAQENIPVTLIFHFEAERFGPMQARMGLEDRQALEFSQFVYP